MSDGSSAPSTHPGVRLERPLPHVAQVILDRPEALNALSTALAVEMTAVLEAVASEEATRAVVVTSSSPRAFCAGADLKERAEFSDAQILEQRPVIRQLFATLRRLPMPTIAGVAGYALGGGCELALSCDIIVADESAVFGLPEVGVGLVPGGGGTQLLPRRIGLGRACDLIFTGRRVDAAEAFRLGLIDRLVPVGQAEHAALDLAEAIAANSPVAIRAAKQAVHSAFGVELPTGLDIEDAAWRTAATSADRREGIAAFVEKRKPKWTLP